MRAVLQLNSGSSPENRTGLEKRIFSHTNRYVMGLCKDDDRRVRIGVDDIHQLGPKLKMTAVGSVRFTQSTCPSGRTSELLVILVKLVRLEA